MILIGALATLVIAILVARLTMYITPDNTSEKEQDDLRAGRLGMNRGQSIPHETRESS